MGFRALLPCRHLEANKRRKKTRVGREGSNREKQLNRKRGELKDQLLAKATFTSIPDILTHLTLSMLLLLPFPDGSAYDQRSSATCLESHC